MPSQYEREYLKLINEIMVNGEERPTRNAPTRSIFSYHFTVNELLWGQFPVLNGRRIFMKGILGELAAFLRSPTHVEDFRQFGCNYWDQWADENGKLVLDYGNAWFDFNGVNQMDELLNSLATNPNGRRHIISSWRPDRLHELSLPCCHLLYQWYVTNDGHLEMIWYQRSVDTMIGLPSDVVLAAMMNILIAEHLGLKPGKLHFHLGDTHIYQSHYSDMNEYIRQCQSAENVCPQYFNEAKLEWFNPEHFSLIDYNPEDSIKFDLH